jgi:glucose/arabinose dehydrogenase
MRKLAYQFAAAAILAASAAHAQVELAPVASGLSNPISIHHANDDRLFIVQQGGSIRILQDGALLPTPFLTISPISTGGERGLLSMAFHPGYEENGYFYVNYTNTSGSTVIARYKRSDANPDVADPASGVTLMTISQPYSNHNGGQLQFGPDGYLYIGMGDGGSGGDPRCYAQREDTLLGKMLRIDVSQNMDTAPYYGIPPTNPHIGAGDPADEVWARGLRNPWRFSFDRQLGDLWIADVGQGNWEEINRMVSLEGGDNYGWRMMEGTRCYSASPTADPCPPGTPPCNDSSLTLPVYEYNHTAGRCSVTGGFVYRGNRAPSLAGKYIFGDYCTAEIWALDPADNSGEPLFTSQGFGLYTFGEDAAGDLYVAIGSNVFRFEEPTKASTLWKIY